MRIAIPVWQGRVSPVFDVATQVLLVDLDANGEVNRQQESLAHLEMEQRSQRLAHWGVDQAICCAVSRGLEILLQAHGIGVTSHICGDVEEVLQAFRDGALENKRFAMPGCCSTTSCCRRGFGLGNRRRNQWRQQ